MQRKFVITTVPNWNNIQEIVTYLRDVDQLESNLCQVKPGFNTFDLTKKRRFNQFDL